MTVLRIPVKSRLSTLIDRPGGVSVGVAVARAEANQATLKDQAMVVVDAALTQLLTTPAPSADDQDWVLRKIYVASNAVIDAAGPFSMTDLCQAAAGLCDLIDAHRDGPFDWRIVQSHAQAMRLLKDLPAEDETGRAALRDHLRQVVERKLGAAEA
ncbi:hypothetical protein ASG17_08780 [Brevundimonas sp. Leaf363]|uniref:hypothetical protein n=1 Tax=Brevundimonas sp. Leaf363 TaxID=1736353 RepID=UPI0006F4DAA1|nr:hypothetical protein [Brevundimonas sp. Leaf363]KQS56116.1 hypothetical protein ASG17_08780 [Brevundimonas sp. Leaf363]